MGLTYSESLSKKQEEMDLLKDIKDVTLATEQKTFVDCGTVSDSENYLKYFVW